MPRVFFWWSTDLQLPASWTHWGLDYPIYTNTQVPWQEDSTSSDTAPQVHLNDYFVTTDLDETYENADLNLTVTVENESAQAA